ncbi:MAG TPA: hypothetical protein VGR21_11560 [Cryptosporangiaceae bacterium]|nr:hypothetical protein [Cryptosporangiaceae bacterium]
MTAVTGLLASGALAFGAAEAGAAPTERQVTLASSGRCAADGQFVVTWTVANGARDKAATLRQPEAEPVGSALDLPTALPAGGRLTGTQTVRRGVTGQAVLTVTAVWSDGVKRTATASYPLPSRACPVARPVAPPVQPGDAKPAAVLTADCDGIVTTLKNSGRSPATFTVLARYGSGGFEKIDEQVVRPGATVEVEYGPTSAATRAAKASGVVADDDAVTLRVVAKGMTDVTASYPPRDCGAPSASPSPVWDYLPTPSELAGDPLPVTGALLAAMVGGAGLALGTGLAMVIAGRRRRRL